MKQFISLFIFLLFTFSLYSQSGSIDITFGQEGFVTTDVFKTDFYASGRATSLQKDGKILVGGNHYTYAALIRYLPNGTVDSSFGNNGIADILATTSGSIEGIAMQPDGKIAVAGNKQSESFTETIFAARFLPEGSLDASFGNGGITGLDFGDYTRVSALALQPDGKLVPAGGAGTTNEAYEFDDITVTRLTVDGNLDMSFGKTGRVKNSVGNNATCILIQPDNKIVTGGYLDIGIPYTNFVTSRYNEDGTMDETFGSKGNVMTDGYGYTDQPGNILLQADGKIVVGGYSAKDFNRYSMIALRYEKNGTPDLTFGEGGKASIAFQDKISKAFAALLQPDGKIVLGVATYKDVTYNDPNYALCRLSSNGDVDSSFAINGRKVTDLNSTMDVAYSALLQPDGKIVLAGSSESTDGDMTNVLLIRYNGDGGQKPLIAKIKRFLHNHGIGWQGLDNTGISYYNVQYSKTGGSYIKKGKVSGAGSSSFRQYEFSVTEAGFYRVVAVDRNGYKTFSNKVTVTDNDIVSAISVYPNPVKNFVTVQGLPTDETTNISIADGSGTVKTRGISNGAAQYRSAVNSLQPGTYYVHITTKDKTETLKFVKK